MKTLVVSLSAIFLAGCNPYPQPIASSSLLPAVAKLPVTSPPPPMYGWEPFSEETFEIHNSQGRGFNLPESASRLRVSVQADSAVFGGVLAKETLVAFQLAHKIPPAADFGRMRCSFQSIDKGEVTCEIDPRERMVFVVRDDRAEGTVALAAFGLFHPSGKLVERAAQPNKIQT
jgi:hypothetical protein